MTEEGGGERERERSREVVRARPAKRTLLPTYRSPVADFPAH